MYNEINMSENTFGTYSDDDSDKEYQTEDQKNQKILSKVFDLLKTPECKENYDKPLPPIPPKKQLLKKKQIQ